MVAITVLVGMVVGWALTSSYYQPIVIEHQSDTIMVEVIKTFHNVDKEQLTLVETARGHQRCYLMGYWGDPGHEFRVRKEYLKWFHPKDDSKNEG
jgi:hypothetical protein